MEVNKSYIELLLQLLNKEENVNIEEYKEELIVNLYLTLLSLSNLEYTEKLDDKEKEIIRDFLTRLCNLKVKIQLKRKAEEITKLAEDLITQYYENINILSIYIKDGIELENIINTMDAKSLTSFSNGYSLAYIEKNQYNFVDVQGNFISEINFESATKFYNGYAQIIQNGKEGVISTLGEITWCEELF